MLGSEKVPVQGGTPVQESNKNADLNERIQTLIGSSDIFLFMKGSPEMPQCGFSANVVSILNSLQINYNTFDILSDWDIREGVKQFSNWPTYPQLYVRGKLVGGNDIIMELHQDGELEDIING
ncbi:MAG: Grx4 family monothiol glutaredoxin [Deltaproteobacteria bacterium]|nr:MAG: Grx4 family monothiol glutaredoxin [Deltaproteobacteria bacterium]